MDNFFIEFEQTTMAVFKRFPEDNRERIQELYTKETEEAQQRLEAQALKDYEEKKRQEEEAAAKEAAADPKAKKKEAPKKGKDEKPDLNVEQLKVPDIEEWESLLGKKFLVERSVEDIAKQIMTPEQDPEEEKPVTERDATQSEHESKSAAHQSQAHDSAAEGEEEE